MAIISICRGTKSGGRALAECLAESLGYPLLGREVLQEAAERVGVPARDLQARMEEKPGILGLSTLLTRVYVAATRAALAEACAEGRLVYHGLAGGRLLQDVPGVLCVRLIAPMDLRVQNLMEAEGMDRASAEAYIRDVDDARERWVRVLYGEDIHDPAFYDVVMNLEAFSVPEACDIVCRLVEQPEFTVSGERLDDLTDFRVESQVQLALLEDLGTQTLELEAEVRRGKAVIRGQAPVLSTGEVGNRILEIVRAVPGVKEVSLQVEWFDPYP